MAKQFTKELKSYKCAGASPLNMEKDTMKYNLDRLNRNPTLNLAIFEAVIDWGNEQEEAEHPEQIPYYCELTATWYGYSQTPRSNYLHVSTHGLIYAKANIDDPKKFGQWDFSRFEIDHTANSDEYDFGDKQDNEQGFEFYCLNEYENYAEISQAAADRLEAIANDFNNHYVHIEYPNGLLNLIGFENGI